jgi:hypothetical protein
VLDHHDGMEEMLLPGQRYRLAAMNEVGGGDNGGEIFKALAYNNFHQ